MNTVNSNSTKADTHSSVVNGVLISGIPTDIIFVDSVSERDALENVQPDTFVALRGLSTIWQYNANGSGSWTVVIQP